MQEFSLLVWNVHKENRTKRFEQTLESLLERFSPDIVLFQEAVLDEKSALLANYLQENGKNIDLPNKTYGVLSASKFPIVEKEQIKTSYKEFFIATKKSLLITTYNIGETLVTVVNLHAINFVPHNIFQKELQKLQERLQTIDTPLIVAGDFNTWSQTRLDMIELFAKNLTLTFAKIEQNHHIKTFNDKPLDHIFYRSLTLKTAQAIDTKNISDHNALYALFEYNTITPPIE